MERFLLYGGIALMAFATVGAAVTLVVSRLANQRLQEQFDVVSAQALALNLW